MKINYESRLLFKLLFFSIHDKGYLMIYCCVLLFCLFFFLPLSSHLVWSGYDFQCVHASIVGLRRAGDSGAVSACLLRLSQYWVTGHCPAQPQISNTPIIQKSRVPSHVRRKKVSRICCSLCFKNY